MEVIPLRPIPSQTLTVPLNGQQCRIDVFERRAYAKRIISVVPTNLDQPDMPLLDDTGHPILDEFGDPVLDDEASHSVGTITKQITYTTKAIFVDLFVNDVAVVLGALAQNGVTVVPDVYLKFDGYLAFVDLQGDARPQTEGLGTRWILAYFPDE